jgi:hypothetical protein
MRLDKAADKWRAERTEVDRHIEEAEPFGSPWMIRGKQPPEQRLHSGLEQASADGNQE